MPTITAHDTDHATIYFHERTGIVHAVFTPQVGGAGLRDALNAGVELLRQRGANKWLSDNRQVPPLSDADTEWINNTWIHNAVNAGWKYWALVVPSDVKAQMNLNDIVQQFYSMDVRIMVFTDPNEAMDWLETIDQVD